MNEERDKRLVVLALERGLVSAAQVEACRALQSQSSAAPPPSILRLLVEQGHLEARQVMELAAEAEPPAAGQEPQAASQEECGFEARTSKPDSGASPGPPDPKLCEMVRELGASTLATTCVVRDPATGHRYVLKVFHPSVARRAGFADRLRAEVALAARIEHPNLARPRTAGTEMDDSFVLSDYVEGAPLDELLRAKGRLSAAEALSVALAGAKALEQADALRLVHGAVSPTNLLVAQDGTVKLADLGVPKTPIGELSIAATGEGVRSPAYLSPEHLDPLPKLDVRSDLFSLGAVLYHCLVGRAPFQGDTTTEVLLAIRGGGFAPVREAAPDVSAALGSIVEKLLQPDPAQRYQAPQDLLADLESFQANRVPEAHRAAIGQARAAKVKVPAPAAEGDAPPRRRWPWLVAGAAVLALAAGGAWLLFRPKGGAEAVEQPAGTPEETALIEKAAKGKQDLEKAILEADAKGKAKGADKLQAAQDAVARLQEIEKEHAGTDVAEEARQRLIPFQAEALFQTALAYAGEHPDDRAGAARRYQEVLTKYPKAAAAFHAGQEIEKLQDVPRKKLLADFDALRKRAADLVAASRFGGAMALYDDFLKKAVPDLLKEVPTEEGRRSILDDVNERILQEKLATNSRAEEAYTKLHDQAQDQVDGQYYEKAKALYAQVIDTFGIDVYVERAKAETAIIQPLLESAAARRLQAISAVKYEFFLLRLDPSLQLARGWDFDGAGREAEKARDELRTAGIENYLDAYLADLALLRRLKRRAIRFLTDPANPVVAGQFSLGKVGDKFDPEWLKAKVTSADETEVGLRYGQVDVHRAWTQFLPDELYRLGKLATDPNEANTHVLLGIHCLYAGLKKTAATEFQAAKAGGQDVDSYLARVELLGSSARKPDSETKQEEASRLLMEAKRMMSESAWDRALYRLATLRAGHEKGKYDLTENLPEINQRIAECKGHVARLALETDLAMGREVDLFASTNFADWQKRLGTWTLEQGVLRGEATGDSDAECLISLHHAASYVLTAKIRIVSGPGAILRLAGKGRPNLGYWLHTTNPALVGLLAEAATDDKPAERAIQSLVVKPNQWYDLRAVVNPATVEVAIGPDASVRMANRLPPDPTGLQTYGFLVNPKSVAEFRDFSVRTLQEQ